MAQKTTERRGGWVDLRYDAKPCTTNWHAVIFSHQTIQHLIYNASICLYPSPGICLGFLSFSTLIPLIVYSVPESSLSSTSSLIPFTHCCHLWVAFYIALILWQLAVCMHAQKHTHAHTHTHTHTHTQTRILVFRLLFLLHTIYISVLIRFQTLWKVAARLNTILGFEQKEANWPHTVHTPRPGSHSINITTLSHSPPLLLPFLLSSSPSSLSILISPLFSIIPPSFLPPSPRGPRQGHSDPGTDAHRLRTEGEKEREREREREREAQYLSCAFT